MHILFCLAVCFQTGDDLASKLRELDARVLPADPDRGRRLHQDARTRIQAANDRESEAWRAIKSREDWERYRDPRVKALRDSLGAFPDPPADLKVRVTRTLEGEGYRIENVVYESRPGLLVTANLYSPAKPAERMPGLIICHSHHNPKTQGELQDMGILWARAGCLVLVLDQLGHGERRQHPFRDQSSYPGSFRPTRQDYYFRYNEAIQLHLIGESLVGWMAWDMMRGVDLLLSRPGIDKERIAILGSVAGGGDPSAVTAAIDRRITAAVIFNFGGPQPETVYPLPADAEKTFNYAGGGSWESTRNLRLSARDGFLPWVIVGSIAPRRLVHAHEFSWDRERDPVWARLGKIYDFYGAPEHLAAAHGGGVIRINNAEATHCNNIGAVHRRGGVYAAFERWFKIPPPAKEPQERRSAEELQCLGPELKTRPLHELTSEIGAERAGVARRRLQGLDAEARRRALREEWTRLLGDVAPWPDARATVKGSDRVGDAAAERVSLEVEAGVEIPLLLLHPARRSGETSPVVVVVSQEGKEATLRNRSGALVALVKGGAAVCLPDLRGSGETSGDRSGGRSSGRTSLSSTGLMLGQTHVGSRLRDLRSVLAYLRGRAELSRRVALCGDSYAPANEPGRRLDVPLDADVPSIGEPLGGLLALFGALFEDDVRAVYVHGGLSGFDSVLQSPFVYIPHDVVIPGAVAAGDLSEVAAALAPRPVRQEALIDGLNRRIRPEAPSRATEIAAWLLAQLEK